MVDQLKHVLLLIKNVKENRTSKRETKNKASKWLLRKMWQEK